MFNDNEISSSFEIESEEEHYSSILKDLESLREEYYSSSVYIEESFIELYSSHLNDEESWREEYFLYIERAKNMRKNS